MSERALHGVNLAGWLSLEPWVSPSAFADSGALEEAELIRSLGTERYRELIQAHREQFMSQDDFKQIAARGFNAVRLVVPWSVYGEAGPDCGPYVACITQVDNAFDWADEYGLKILLVLGVSPGNNGLEAELVRNHSEFRNYKDQMVEVVAALAKRYSSRAAFYGLEVADAPRAFKRVGLSVREGVPIHILRNYYRNAYEAVRAEAGTDPVVVIPDAGNSSAFKQFMAHDKYARVMLDIHLFHYKDSFKTVGPAGIRNLVEQSQKSIKQAQKSGLPVMVGKWSGALPYPDTMSTPEGKIALERVYIAEQIAAFEQCPAWFFQTWKTESKIAGWDARKTLATFERRMISS